MTASGRQLLQQDLDGQPAITTVTTALQFLEAVNTAAGHIVVLEHINVAGTYESGGHSIPVNSDVLSLTVRSPPPAPSGACMSTTYLHVCTSLAQIS